MGPYTGTTITTRKTDVTTEKTDNKPSACSVLIGLILLGPALWVVAFMGLFCWTHIGLISVVGIIGLTFWACGHFGTDNSILDRFRYRTTPDQRSRIDRRLSGAKKNQNRS